MLIALGLIDAGASAMLSHTVGTIGSDYVGWRDVDRIGYTLS